MTHRWLRFCAVGAGGTVVQLLSLVLLVEGLRLHYSLSSLAAIEAAVLHNFLWHVRWTWRDRLQGDVPGRRRSIARRLVLFHGTNGLVSLAGSVALMPVLVSALRLHYVVATITVIAICAASNFVLGDRVVFGQSTT